MILAVDAYYRGKTAVVAGVTFRNWPDAEPFRKITIRSNNVQEYIPGHFYKRELPCIMTLLDQLNRLPKIIVIDGFVQFGRKRRPGLGKHLYNKLNGSVAVIGVAKNPFKDPPLENELYRCNSKRALYVTSMGIDFRKAKTHIANMHGKYRIPTLLKRVDQLCRSYDL